MCINQINIIKQFYETANKSPSTWLEGRSYSDSFVICIAAGPWKFNRRKSIQQLALNKLNGKDLIELDKIDWFPLKWQNDILNNLIFNIKLSEFKSFEELCKDHVEQAKEFPHLIRVSVSAYCGYHNDDPPKVISLFMRDALKIASFPIDRHVKRKLQEMSLPVKESEVISLCLKAELDPRLVAYSFVKEASDMENPDWSLK